MQLAHNRTVRFPSLKIASNYGREHGGHLAGIQLEAWSQLFSIHSDRRCLIHYQRRKNNQQSDTDANNMRCLV